MKRTIKIAPDLAAMLDPLLKARNVTLDNVIDLYLRAMVNSINTGKSLKLSDVMPYGKYRGAVVETIVAADPGYLRYLMSGERPTQFEPEVLEKLK